MKTMNNKYIHTQYKAIIKKDLKETLGNKQILLPMIIVPAIFIILIPTAILVVAGFADRIDTSEIMKMTENMKLLLPYEDNAKNLITLFSNYYLPPLFLIIPLMMSSLLGAGCFVSEKEKNTLESLFYCPISVGDLFKAKVMGTFIPAYALTICSFIITGLILNIGGYLFFGHLIFPSLKWLLILFLLSPSVLLLGLTLIVHVSAKAKSFQEAQQIVGFVVIPIILLIVGQATGIVLLNELIIIIVSAFLFAIDYFLLRRAKKKYYYERLLQ